MALPNRASLLDDEDDPLEGLVNPPEEAVEPDQLDMAALPQGPPGGYSAGADQQNYAPGYDQGPPPAPPRTPPSELRGDDTFPQIFPGTQPPPQGGPKMQRLQADIDRAPLIYQQKPPGIWNKLGAVGLGAAQGWINSNPRGKPVDFSAGIENIMHPGQKRKEAQYEKELSLARAGATTEQANEIAGARVGEYNARAGAETKRGAYYDTQSAKAAKAPQTTLEKYNAYMTSGIPNMTEEIALALATGHPPPAGGRKTVADIEAGLLEKVVNAVPGSPDDKKYRDLLALIRSGAPKEPKEPRVPTSAQERLAALDADTTMDPATKAAQRKRIIQDEIDMHPNREPKPDRTQTMTSAQKVQIETRKQNSLRSLAQQTQKRLSDGIEPPEQVYADEANTKQQIQDGYEAEIESVTGNSPGHFQYPAGTQPAQPQAAPAPPGTADKVRVKTGDGQTGFIPRANLKKAQQLDPRLQILDGVQ